MTFCEPYSFNDKSADGQSIVHLINIYFGEKDIVGAEVGVGKALTFCTLLQNCPWITTLYGVDNYKPYSDYVTDPYDETTPNYSVDEKTIEFIKNVAYHNIKYSGYEDRVIFMEMDSQLAATKIENESLDFVFLDTYMTYEQACQDIEDWYCKVKTGGLFIGHDWSASVIKKAVRNFRFKNNISSFLSTFDNTWVWIK